MIKAQARLARRVVIIMAQTSPEQDDPAQGGFDTDIIDTMCSLRQWKQS